MQQTKHLARYRAVSSSSYSVHEEKHVSIVPVFSCQSYTARKFSPLNSLGTSVTLITQVNENPSYFTRRHYTGEIMFSYILLRSRF